MEHLTPSQLQKLLEDEATALRTMQSKISNQVHLLQVEEEIFRQELEKLQKEGLAKDYANQEGVNQIVEVSNEDVADEDNNSIQTVERGKADAENGVVEIAGDDLAPACAVPETQEVPQEKGAKGVNRIVEITGDEDEIMGESTGEGYGPSSTSRPWSEEHHASLEYEILEPSSDESETDVEDSNSRKKRMHSMTFPSELSRTIVGEKRRREEPAEPGRELNSREHTQSKR